MLPDDDYTAEFPAPEPTVDDGGQAFPTPHFQDSVQGMSLRDWFAGQEQGFDENAVVDYARRFNPDPFPLDEPGTALAEWWAKADAALRYIKADAMIAARKGGAS